MINLIGLGLSILMAHEEMKPLYDHYRKEEKKSKYLSLSIIDIMSICSCDIEEAVKIQNTIRYIAINNIDGILW